jgi:hypothetical protein
MHTMESFLSARRSIGKVESGMRSFVVTRGQFTMADAVFEILRQTTGQARLSVWAWGWADSEGQTAEAFRQFCASSRIETGLLLTDGPKDEADPKFIAATAVWRERFGPSSVKNVNLHAKIITLEVDGMRFLIRGSMNLLKTPRFENLDISEGCAGFETVRAAEESFPLPSLITRLREKTWTRTERLSCARARKPRAKTFTSGS